MSLRIHNTLTNSLEEFKPIEPGKVRMYVCGVTVYDDIHMGHARSMIVFDMVARYLRYSGYEVRTTRSSPAPRRRAWSPWSSPRGTSRSTSRTPPGSASTAPTSTPRRASASATSYPWYRGS